MAAGLRGSQVLVEVRLDVSVHARFRERYLSRTELPPPPPQADAAAPQPNRGCIRVTSRPIINLSALSLS